MAYRASIWIVIFLVSFNGGAVFLDAVGVDDYLGISSDVGDVDEIDQATEQSQFETGTGRGATLFGTYNRLAGVLNNVLNALMPGAEMLKNAWPDPTFHLAVNFVFGVLVMIPPIDLAMFLRGT